MPNRIVYSTWSAEGNVYIIVWLLSGLPEYRIWSAEGHVTSVWSAMGIYIVYGV